jgi:TrmH family RNA methyltransferase
VCGVERVDTDLVARFRRARGDDRLVVLEGFHALKHALRFGARVRDAVATDVGALERLAAELAPDLAGRFAALARPVGGRGLRPARAARAADRVLALAERPPVDAATVLAAALGSAPVVLLEDPRDLGNLGACVRVAAAAGVSGLVTTGDRDPWAPEALRGAAGLHFALPVARAEAFPHPPPTDRPIVAIDPAGAPLRPAAVPAGAVLAFGTERAGLSDALLARADATLALPMTPGVSSLNLATAVAATLYAWRLR